MEKRQFVCGEFVSACVRVRERGRERVCVCVNECASACTFL